LTGQQAQDLESQSLLRQSQKALAQKRQQEVFSLINGSRIHLDSPVAEELVRMNR